MILKKYSASLLLLAILMTVCATPSIAQKKRKRLKKQSFLGRTYQNINAHYNGYFNANEIYETSLAAVKSEYRDNYTQLLPLYPAVAASPGKAVEKDMETAIGKLAAVVDDHRRSDWTDDAYLLFGKCRFLEKDYEGAEKAFDYLVAEFNLEGLEIKKNIGKKRKKSKKKKSKNKEDKPESYFLVKRPAFEEGQLWLARTYTERENYDEASLLLSTIKSNPKTHKKHFDEIAEAQAYNELKQKNYGGAVTFLEEAYSLSKRKRRKVRYAYIMAQLYQLENKPTEALASFKKVLKNAPNYEMEFNTRLSMATNAWEAGTESAESIVKSLDKMLKESKNKEYQDRIYFALAQVYFKNKQEKEGLAALKKSLALSKGNGNQKAESYLMLGDQYYQDEEFVQAKHYYDSTLIDLAKNDPRFERIEGLSKDLESIAKNVEIINLQDSLLAIHDMKPAAKRQLAARLIKEREAAKQKAQQASAAGAGGTTNLLGAAKSSFFAYSDKSLKRGKKNFDKRWGTRILEDDWRRSNKKGGGAITEDTSEEDIAENLTAEEIDDIFKDVPKNKAQVQKAKFEIKRALFDLGVDYRNKLENNRLAIEALERLVKQYPANRNKLDAYYNLHLAHKAMKHPKEAEFYKNKLMKDFPESTYAKVLKDPNYLKTLNASKEKTSAYYEKAYALFQQRNYKKAYDMLDGAGKKLGNLGAMEAKFALLKAMCVGSVKDKEAYRKAMSNVASKYRETPEGEKAQEIIRYLDGTAIVPTPKPTKENKLKTNREKDRLKAAEEIRREEKKKKDKKSNKTKDKKSSKKAKKGPKATYKMEDKKGHYLLIALAEGTVLKDVKDSARAYNKEHYAKKPYSTSTLYLLGKEVPILMVRRFKNRGDASSYAQKVSADVAKFLGKGNEGEVLIISQTNYRSLLKSKDMAAYIKFYNENYR